MDWALLIRQWRSDAGLSLIRAGTLLGVAHTTVRDWERGRRPRDVHRRALSDVLGVQDPDRAATPLRLHRDILGLSMNELAGLVHVSSATVSQWERGLRRPARSYLPHLALALRLPEDKVAGLFDGYPVAGARERVALASLRERRLQSGIAQRALAHQLGISVPTLYEWESAKAVVPASAVPRLAAALGVSVEALTAPAIVRARNAANRAPLSRLRCARGLTQRHVADRLGVSVKHLAALEAGRRVLTLSSCHALARIYRCPFREVARAGNLIPEPMLDRARWVTGTLPAVLRTIRHHRNEHATTVAAHVGVAPDTLRRWEAGKGQPNAVLITRLENYYGLRDGELINLLAPADRTRRPRRSGVGFARRGPCSVHMLR